VAPNTGVGKLIRAHIDTGAQITILDHSVARDIEMDLSSARTVDLTGLGGQVEGRAAEVELRLLDQPELTLRLEVVFVERMSPRLGNLISLDVLEHFDLGLPHRQRIGYLGRSIA
jgi:hypothetical protein